MPVDKRGGAVMNMEGALNGALNFGGGDGNYLAM
jgi:hypothetical protein